MRWLAWVMPLSLTLLTGCFDLKVCGIGGGGGCVDGPPIDTSDFVGSWINEDPQPNQLVKVEVREGGEASFARVWAYCEFKTCYIGESPGHPKSGEGPDNPEGSEQISIDFEDWTENRLYVYRLYQPLAGRMPIFNAAFVLGEERVDYEAKYYLVKSG